MLGRAHGYVKFCHLQCSVEVARLNTRTDTVPSSATQLFMDTVRAVAERVRS
jgi:hypothetical protein